MDEFFFFLQKSSIYVKGFWFWSPKKHKNSFLFCFPYLSFVYLLFFSADKTHKRPTMESLKPAKQRSSLGSTYPMVVSIFGPLCRYTC
ncbi:hypothetical protein V6Z11_A03G238900 [Gossypium hirsutum]